MASANREPSAQVIGHHPSTVAEIQDVEREIAALDIQLLEEARELYEALRKGGAPALPPASMIGASASTSRNTT
jgi:hypothetical protein